MQEPAQDPDDEPAGPPLWPILRWSIPLHALLPALIGAAWVYGGDWGDAIVNWTWMLIHLGFPVALVLSYPWWRGRGDELAGIIVINHVVTIVAGVALISWSAA